MALINMAGSGVVADFSQLKTALCKLSKLGVMQKPEPSIYPQWLEDVKKMGDHAYKSWRYKHLISRTTFEFSDNRHAEMMIDEYDSAIRIFRVLG